MVEHLLGKIPSSIKHDQHRVFVRREEFDSLLGCERIERDALWPRVEEDWPAAGAPQELGQLGAGTKLRTHPEQGI